jgi:hypothetical protein
MGKPKADRKAKVEKRDDKGRFAQGNPGGGRDTVYTDELGDRIAERLAGGETLIAICRDKDMPSERTVRNWALDLAHPFSPKYTRGRELGYMRMADELVDIIDNGQNDWMERHGKDDAGWVANGEHASRSRLRFEGRKWLLAKALPKVYGDKVALTDAEGGKLTVEIVRFSGGGGV